MGGPRNLQDRGVRDLQHAARIRDDVQNHARKRRIIIMAVRAPIHGAEVHLDIAAHEAERRSRRPDADHRVKKIGTVARIPHAGVDDVDDRPAGSPQAARAPAREAGLPRVGQTSLALPAGPPLGYSRGVPDRVLIIRMTMARIFGPHHRQAAEAILRGAVGPRL